MSINPSRVAATEDQAYEEALARMLAAREHVRRWWSPEAMAAFDPDAPEVVGVPDPEIMRDDL